MRASFLGLLLLILGRFEAFLHNTPLSVSSTRRWRPRCLTEQWNNVGARPR